MADVHNPLITDNFCITSFAIISCEAREWKRKKTSQNVVVTAAIKLVEQ